MNRKTWKSRLISPNTFTVIFRTKSAVFFLSENERWRCFLVWDLFLPTTPNEILRSTLTEYQLRSTLHLFHEESHHRTTKKNSSISMGTRWWKNIQAGTRWRGIKPHIRNVSRDVRERHDWESTHHATAVIVAVNVAVFCRKDWIDGWGFSTLLIAACPRPAVYFFKGLVHATTTPSSSNERSSLFEPTDITPADQE